MLGPNEIRKKGRFAPDGRRKIGDRIAENLLGRFAPDGGRETEDGNGCSSANRRRGIGDREIHITELIETFIILVAALQLTEDG